MAANDFFADMECIEKDQPAVVGLSTITDCTLLTLSKVEGSRLAKQLPVWERQGAMQAMYEMVRKQEFLRVGQRRGPVPSLRRALPCQYRNPAVQVSDFI